MAAERELTKEVFNPFSAGPALLAEAELNMCDSFS